MSESIAPAGVNMKAHIAQLYPGESWTRCRKLPIDRVTHSVMTREISELKNTVNSAMRRVANDTGADYTLDNLQIITPNKDVMLIAVVTRTA